MLKDPNVGGREDTDVGLRDFKFGVTGMGIIVVIAVVLAIVS